MAYVNVRDWSVDQVTDWLKGLDGIILQYTTSFLNNNITGHQLLNLRADDLDNLGVRSLGHQELILEAVEHLRQFHYELDKENLQMLALKVSCASNSLYRELLLLDDEGAVQTQTMADVHNIISAIKPLVCWLDRAPFLNIKNYMETTEQLLQLSFLMATNAHRGIFSEKPLRSIREFCEKITKLADHIIQEVSDPMILQPASLDLATLKKKEQELGFFILPNNHAVHQIAEIKYGSPAHSSSKIEEGDEIVQVNYQTVVGWQRKNVMILLQDSPPEIVLTLKKRPRHTHMYGQIYMKPYRLPSKKRDGHPYSRWNDNIPSPRLLPIHNLPPINITRLTPVTQPLGVDTELSSSDDSESSDIPFDGSSRVYPLKPRPILQRRNTISGATPTSKLPYPSAEQYWKLWKDQAASIHSSSYHIDHTKFDTDSNFFRDKSASCNLGIELSPRPTTIIGISQTRTNKCSFNDKPSNKHVIFQEIPNEKKNSYLKVPEVNNLNNEKSISVNSLASLTNENIGFIDEGRELTDRSNMTTKVDEIKAEDKTVRDVVLANVNIHAIIKKFDEEKTECMKPKIYPRTHVKNPSDSSKCSKKPVVPPRSVTTKLRGKLDKSYSTPAYDLTGEEESCINQFALEQEESISKNDGETVVERPYELGIPIVEAINPTFTPLLHPHQFADRIEEHSDDLPPKPPPRTFGLVDLNKPAYPIDSPKPQIMDKTKIDNVPKTTLFKFPETGDLSLNIGIPTVIKTPEPHSKATTSNENNKSINKFEPKLISTPKTKSSSGQDTNMYKNSSSFEVQKSTSDSKISPTNSIVRAMIYPNKNKGGKKKSAIAAKRRRVTVFDLSPCDLQGFLYQRLRSKHNQNVHWERRWFVILGSCLYGFRTKEDQSAVCLIFLSGFTVAVANEVKSRSNAFRVYHTGTAFYFSAEDPESLQSWIDIITSATLRNDQKSLDGARYSETDDESDIEKSVKLHEKTPEILCKFGSLKKISSKKGQELGGSTSLDRKWFFNKSSHTKNSLPVPTAQFRSYRKIKTNEEPFRSVTTGNFTSHVSFITPRLEIPKLQQSTQNGSVPNLTVEHLETSSMRNEEIEQTENLLKIKPINYIHASNPSLRNLNDYNISSSFDQRNFKHCNENLAGFVTLEELMNKQSEERKSNPYNADEDFTSYLNNIKPDVVYGEIPIRPKDYADIQEGHNPSDVRKPTIKQDTGSSCFGKRFGSLKKAYRDESTTEFESNPTVSHTDHKLNRSLPRTHKLVDNCNTTTARYASDRNLALKDRSYEMIYCPETTSYIQYAQNRNLDNTMYKDTQKKRHKLKQRRSFSSDEKIHVAESSSKKRLKSAIQYTPISLPSHQDSKGKAKLAFEFNNLDDKAAKSGKFKQMFGKPDGKKEKTFLGSPKLHRAIFRKNSSGVEISYNTHSTQPVSLSQSSYSIESGTLSEAAASNINISPHADYPGLEYPPVFEPETYSLADPQSSLTLLRRQGKDN